MKSRTDLALLLVRVGLGVVFALHGWQKVNAMEGTIAFFGTLGLPAFIAYAVAYIEFIGGLLLIIGLFTKVAAILLAVVMIGAIVKVKFAKGFLGGYEFDFMLLMASLAIAVSSSGAYSIDRLWKKEDPRI